jgi:putative flippase GtrA
MTIPLPNPLSTTETVLIGLLLLFFALWGWRHGLDAAIIWGLFVIFAAWAAPELAVPLGKIVNAIIGMIRLLMDGQFSMSNWSAVMNAQSQVVEAPVNVQDPNSSSMQLLTLAIFGMITYIGFRYALKKAGKKDPIIASFFGAVGAVVVGYIIARFVLDRLFTFPQTVEITPSDIPPINVNATVLVAVVLVLVVFGIQRSKPPAKKG